MNSSIVLWVSCTLLLSFCLSAVLIWLSRTGQLPLVRQGDLGAIQAAHSLPTPRLGGVAIMMAYLIVCGFAFANEGALWAQLGLSVAPLFLSGVAEDLGYRVSPVGRLGAALLASSLAVLLTGAWITETGIAVLDPLFVYAPLATFVTIVAAATISHAFNLIDGLNGLSGSTAVLSSIGIAATAVAVGDEEIAVMAVLLSAATFGFLLLNFPSGKIFLGDAGAYTLGFLLAWLGIALTARSADVTPIAMVLILFWPLADLSLAIFRRRKRNLPVSHPDRLHFHHLAMRGLEICLLGRGRRQVANPLATFILTPMIAVPVVLGALLHAQPMAAVFALMGSFGAFFALYGLGMRMAAGRSRSVNISGFAKHLGRRAPARVKVDERV
jgi:UDP-GlcNAc:undecaprenyl-phosphate GlcNAc-1-phosphate transferase